MPNIASLLDRRNATDRRPPAPCVSVVLGRAKLPPSRVLRTPQGFTPDRRGPDGTGLACEQVQDILAVDGALWKFRPKDE
ncbi:MAG: hypothetical protein KAI66_14645 [Lentisphaeria bacterium]|nr:hypothetical protein [Lentisphaeria bacterium]